MDFRGVFTIPCTPFREDGSLDEASLRREVRFCLECGAHGLVAPVNASEFYTLTDAERLRVMTVIAEENAGRVPFVAGCSAVSAAHGVMLTRHAHSIGAAAIMAMPPVIRKAAGDEIFEYYRALSEATPLPIVLQDFAAPLGTPMSVELMARMVREIPNVRYLKEETPVGTHVLSRLKDLVGEEAEGIMGGQGGRFIFNEYTQGVLRDDAGVPPDGRAGHIWNMLDSGSEAEARRVFNRTLPLLNFEQMYQVAAYKEVLRRRGVIATSVCRGAPAVLDAIDLRELEVLMGEIEPLLKGADVTL